MNSIDAASKGALDTFTIGLSQEVAAEGIRVNAVRPAFIYTEMHASGGEPNRVDRVKSLRADEARRHGRRSGARRDLAAVERGLVHDWSVHRRHGRTMRCDLVVIGDR
jgi:NAD(P)-dependent dehydrogenase (short-subunit alcohol dehydrogenase family)